MTEPQGDMTPEDIAYDLEGAEKRAAWVERLASDAPPPPGADRDLEPCLLDAQGGPPPGAPGEHFIARRPPGLRGRYRTLLHLEAAYQYDHDFACLLASACGVLEAELEQLLVGPARAIAGPLVGALEAAGKRDPARVLRDWADGRVPATIGTATQVLLALRCGLGAGDGDCRAFLAGHFRPAYAALVANKEFGKALDRIRQEYRNPACHGLRAFAPTDYQQFARLAVGRGRLGEWAAAGPLPEDPPGAGCVLHHHLAESLLLPAAVAEPPGPVERLLALGRPRASGLRIRLEPQPAAGPPSDPRTDAPPRLPQPLRLGDRVRFAFQAGQDCEVALIDVGTSGKVAVVLPSALQPQAAVRGGQTGWLPTPGGPRTGFALTGWPGRERVVALAWRGTLPGWLRPTGSEAFRTLAAGDVARLCNALESTDPDHWAACVCEFEILA